MRALFIAVAMLALAGCAQEPTPETPHRNVEPAESATAEKATDSSTVSDGAQFELKQKDQVGAHGRILKVLYLEQSFRWQARALNDALKRDSGLEYQGFFFDSQDGWTQPVSTHKEKDRPEPLRAPFWRGSKPVETLDAFMGLGYDVVVVGDVNHEEPRFKAEYWEWLEHWVSSGGGLVLAAGQTHNPAKYTEIAAVRALHPLDLKLSDAKTDVRVVKYWGVTEQGRKHPICALANESAQNAELWGRERNGEYERGKLHGLYWFATAGAPRDGTTVLARVAVEGQAIAGGAPLVAIRQHGKGRVIWLGSDDTHYFREFVGDAYFYRLWQNMFAWAAER